MITSVAFTPDGARLAVGLFRGQVFFYKTEDLRIETQIVCTKKRSKRKAKYGYKVTGLVFRTINEHLQHRGEGDTYELLVTTNDSSIRLYQVKDLSLTTKFKGFVNKSKPIRASFSNLGDRIICGSDTTGVFIWKVPKRRHMEIYFEKLNHSRETAPVGASNSSNNTINPEGPHVTSIAGGEKVGENDKEEQLRARLESLYYSKKYEVYSKYEKFVCEDNFKHLCTTVAIYAPPAALEAAMHLTATGPDGSGDGDGEDKTLFNTVILDAEMNGTIRIIRAKSLF